MSAYLYGAFLRNREAASKDKSKREEAPGVSPYVDALAAIVPAEVLALHALAISLVAPTVAKKNGDVSTVIADTDRPFLIFVFVACVLLSMGLYAIGHKRRTNKEFDGIDYVRMIIPALAFVAWTMAQKTTAWDAIAPSMTEPFRFFVAALAAVILGVFVGSDSNKEDKRDPSGRPPRVT